MDIGKEQRTITVEPVENPVPLPEPIRNPPPAEQPEQAPVEPVEPEPSRGAG